MSIIEPTIRPPAEAQSFLLQVTLGCSSYTCSFCGAYQGKKFSIKEEKEIFYDIERGARLHPFKRKVFLLDGDALAVPNKRLIPVLEKLDKSFPKLRRVSSYANGYNISSRSDNELKKLKENKLSLIYMGLESGSSSVLKMRKKKSSAEEMIEGARRCSDTGIKTSIIVLLGLGGKRYSAEHVRETIRALNKMQPDFLSFLSVMLIPGTELYKEAERGDFKELSPKGLLRESFEILKGIDMKRTVFRSNHASNYLPLRGRLPKDKTRLLELTEKAMKDNGILKPEYLRGL